MMNHQIRHEEQGEHATSRAYRYALDRTAIVAITDPAGTITYVNDKFCEISRYSRDELLGQNHRILNSGRHPRAFFSGMFRVIARGQTWRGDICNRAKDGSIYWVDTTIIPVLGDSGRVEKYVAIRSDITARKLAEEASERAVSEMQETCRVKSEFLANMSHEIRTPLTAILGYAELLDADIDAEERSNHIDVIRRNGEHLLMIINDVLDLSKFEAGMMAVEKVTVSPVGLVASIYPMMKARAENKGLDFELCFTGPVPASVTTDPVRLRQILVNLLSNAVKFTEVGTVGMRVGLEPGDGGSRQLLIEVFDTGIGIEPEQQAMLFRAFQQADASTTRRFGGTGLGLHISQRLAGLLGGEISVRSRAGEGSTFTLIIPLTETDETIEPDEAHRVVLAGPDDPTPVDERKQHPGLLHGTRVLLAEDGPDNQRLISHFLRQAGGIVTVVENGKQAVVSRPHDLILMDIQMPVMDGYEATRMLRASGCNTPVIALTAHTMPEDRDRCLAAGCNDYLTKPVDREKLITTVNRWAKRRRRAA